MRKVVKDEIDKILEELNESLEIRRYSEATKKRYTSVLKGYLLREQEKGKNLRELTEEDVIQYLKELTQIRNYKASSYNNVNAILKYYLEVVLDKNISYRKLPNAKIGYRLPVVASKSDYEKILKEAENIRDKCFLKLAYGSGLRVSEIANLRIKNINSKHLKIVQIGKGNKERMTVLPLETLMDLREYCRENKITKKDDYIFLNKEGKHISPATVSFRIKELSDRSGVRKSAHKLRGGFATTMLRMGVPLLVVQSLMGHTSPETTSKYSEIVRLEDKIKNPLEGEFNE